MRIKTIIACTTCLMMAGAVASADETDALKQLDKEWGESVGPEALAPLLSDDVLALGSEGIGRKADMLEAAESDGEPTGPYVAGDYEVRFLDDDTAVMIHSAAAPDPHWSMHVWQKQDGKWQVAATATVPIEE